MSTFKKVHEKGEVDRYALVHELEELIMLAEQTITELNTELENERNAMARAKDGGEVNLLTYETNIKAINSGINKSKNELQILKSRLKVYETKAKLNKHMSAQASSIIEESKAKLQDAKDFGEKYINAASAAAADLKNKMNF